MSIETGYGIKFFVKPAETRLNIRHTQSEDPFKRLALRKAQGSSCIFVRSTC